jgi:serine/threonine protein kinase/Flp pilus assembly protein TadD
LGAELPSRIVHGFNPGADSKGFAREKLGESSSDDSRHDSIAGLIRVSQWLGSEEVARDAAEWKTDIRRLPHSGDEFRGFRLLRELGRGAFARVFLAEQIALAGRRVAVKISRAKRDESQTLAQLQHTHIVPVYSAHEDAESGLRILVMPYFGGTTLAELLEKAGVHVNPAATGQSLVTALFECASRDRDDGTSIASSPASTTAGEGSRGAGSFSLSSAGAIKPAAHSRLLGRGIIGAWRASARSGHAVGAPALHVLEQSNYIRAVAWITARLAEALTHAHQRGILHRDIKPSNVLIARDGQPMLLDFNLARDLKSTESGAVAYLGGTLPYMAPEHLDAFNVENSTPPSAVDNRSDLYSLGVVFFEMLTGKLPFRLEPPDPSLPVVLERMACDRRNHVPSARLFNPAIPMSLDAIVQHCLQPDPAQRYQHAAELAEDLQRELDDRPLRHTREPSRWERVRKWMRRHPRFSSAGPLAAAAALLFAGLGALVLSIGGLLAGYDAEGRWLRFQQGLVRAQLLVHTGHEPGEDLTEGQAICKRTLDLFDVLESDHWMEHPRLARLRPEQRSRLFDQVTELMLLLARVRAEQSRMATSASQRRLLLQEAVGLLDRAGRWQPDQVPRALYEDRSNYRRMLGDPEGAERDLKRALVTPVRTARDHYLRATSLAMDRRYDEAISELGEALRLDPRHFWALFELGVCYDQLGRLSDARGAYLACIALWPECPWPYFNRGLVSSRLGNWDEARSDYAQAIERAKDSMDSSIARDAHLNRGLASLNQHRYAEALDDLSRAVELGSRSAAVWAAQGAARAGLGRFDDAQGDFKRALEERPGDEGILLSRGFALVRHWPQQSLSDFDRVLSRNPQSARAHYGRALALSAISGEEPAALASVEQALTLDPQLVTARSALAVLLARMGEFDRSLREAEATLARAEDGPTYYAAASAYALASRESPQHQGRALQLLQLALEQHYGRDLLDSDPDLDPLRDQPQFRQFLRSQ